MSCPGPYLSDWLNAIATWCDSQPQHAPITLTIDIKDDLNDNLNVENGNLIALNRILSETLGQKMVLAEQWTAPWPSIESLRGSIIVVLSGHEGTRLAYVRDRGQCWMGRRSAPVIDSTCLILSNRSFR